MSKIMKKNKWNEKDRVSINCYLDKELPSRRKWLTSINVTIVLASLSKRSRKESCLTHIASKIASTTIYRSSFTRRRVL